MNRWMVVVLVVMLVLVGAMALRNATVSSDAPLVAAHGGAPVPPIPWKHGGAPVPPIPWKHGGAPVPPIPWNK
jgi:hypothetical protein